MQAKLPKKISPDHIRDAFIQIRYIPIVPVDAVLGLVFKALDHNYVYQNNRPYYPENNGFEVQIGNNVQVFLTEKISIQLQPYSIIFNLAPGKSYIGWHDYITEVQKFLNYIENIGVFAKIDSIGIRYISEYINKDINEMVDFKFGFGMPEVNSKTYSFKSEFELENHRIILNLHNKLPKNAIANNFNVENEFLTHIDIDVISQTLNIINGFCSNILIQLNITHSLEKQIFWSLLKETYKQNIITEF
jgi:uncharacterized protein (TIGR04255 family)